MKRVKSMIMMDFKKYIVAKSREMGIDIIGFCDTKPFHHLHEFLMTRREEGHETEFEEKDIELRISPEKILPQAKSIIAIGMSYNVDQSFSEKNNDTPIAMLSRSSWGIDYHVILREKLNELVKKILEVQDFNYKVYVDTGPLLDREVAKRAGIGWYGKNNSIINDKFGSFIFIGYILTDLEISPNKTIDKQCGSCNVCLEACPTGAIGNDHRINARTCISYLTQTKENIPYNLREKMGTQVYGCDICQNCCPQNKGIIITNNTSFIPHKTEGSFQINELFHMSNREFKKKYGHISASWRGKNILKRNCIIALGNLKDKNSIEILTKAMEDQNSMIREYSAWALLKIDRKLGRKIVIDSMKIEKNNEVKEELQRLLEYFEGDAQ